MSEPKHDEPKHDELAMELSYDVVIVGAGPAGLAAAIALKQRQPALQVCLLEKGAEVGAHLLSGALVPLDLLDALFADHAWHSEPPQGTRVQSHSWRYLLAKGSLDVPMSLLPPALRRANEPLQILSLGALSRWLADEAQALGVEIFTAQAVVAGCYNRQGRLVGVQTAEAGRTPEGEAGPGYAPGIRIGARYTLVAEGARGSLSRELEVRYDLRRGVAPQRYALGLKECWQSPTPRWQAGEVIHTLGWPIPALAGGGFIYASSEYELQLGLVLPLDYGDSELDPFARFMQFKQQPQIANLLSGAERQGFGARTLAEGGWQALGRLSFPGGALLGCAAGLLDLRRQQGIPAAIASGMVAAESLIDALRQATEGTTEGTLTKSVDGTPNSEGTPTRLAAYEAAVRQGPIGQALREAQAIKPAFTRLGSHGGLLYLGLHYWLTQWGLGLPLLKGAQADHLACLQEARRLQALREGELFCPPEPAAVAPGARAGELQQERDSALFFAHLTGGAQPCHLQGVKGASLNDEQQKLALRVLSHCCPGGVYHLEPGRLEPGCLELGQLSLQPENCLHCKCCEIKDPRQQVRWTPPEGGSGPRYRLL